MRELARLTHLKFEFTLSAKKEIKNFTFYVQQWHGSIRVLATNERNTLYCFVTLLLMSILIVLLYNM